MKKRIMQRSSLLVAALMLGLSTAVAVAQAVTPPPALLQYVKQAKQAGIKDDQIRRNALSAGWPESAVKAVLQATEPSPKETGKEPANAQPGNEAPPSGDGGPQAVLPASPVHEGTPAVGSLPGGTRPEPDRGAPDDYVIGAGDVLSVSVWKEPDASAGGLVVRNDGKITMPLLKDVVVAGMTLRQAEAMITEKLSKYLTVPDVAVMATSITSQKVYLIGAVKHEGPMPLTFKMNILQAISEAGGLTDYAKKNKIYVLRTEAGREFKFLFDYTAVLKGTRMEMNIVLRPGDTIVVPH
jgi:polysaccharide biosynthesis/export protein